MSGVAARRKSRSGRGVGISALVVWGVLVVSLAATPALGGRAARESARALPTPWPATGTVTLIADLDRTLNGKDPYGVPQSAVVKYHEKAVFRLTGGKTVGVYFRAQMTGSGTGTMTYSGGQSGTCTLNDEPLNEWSYTGPAQVGVWYASGKVFVVPRAVMKTVHTVLAGCGSTQPLTRPALNPFYASVTPTGQKVSQTAKVVAGSKHGRIGMTALGLTNVEVGTATLSWNLHRASRAAVKP